MCTNIRISQMGLFTDVLGPGKRVVIWTQGCEKRCPGCMSPDKRDPMGGKSVPIDKLVEVIDKLSVKDGELEGITISGGDPFLQSDKLHIFLTKIKTKTDLGVIIYTGYTMGELLAKNTPEINDIVGEWLGGTGKGLCDLIIDGEYVEELNDNSAMRGSSNQKLCYVTDRYRAFEADYNKKERNIEVLYQNNNDNLDMVVVGVPSKDTLEKIRNMGTKD